MTQKQYKTKVVIESSYYTVKAATLIFIAGRGSAISSVKQRKSGSKELRSCFGRANVRAFHENPNRIHTELTSLNP